MWSSWWSGFRSAWCRRRRMTRVATVADHGRPGVQGHGRPGLRGPGEHRGGHVRVAVSSRIASFLVPADGFEDFASGLLGGKSSNFPPPLE